MKNAFAWVCAACAFSISARCLAQEGPPATPLVPVAPPVAPADPPRVVSPAPGNTNVSAAPDREQRRRFNRRDREVQLFLRVSEREGTEFSKEKYERYRGLESGGVLFVVLGSLSVITGAVYGFYSIGKELSQVNWDSESEDDDTQDDYETNVGLLAGLLVSGAASLGLGITLTAAGRRGKRRQELLLHKREILAPYGRPQGVTLSLFGDPSRGAGGVVVSATF